MAWADQAEDGQSDPEENEQSDSEEDHEPDNIWSGSSEPWGAAWIGYLDRHHISESSLMERHEIKTKKRKKKHRHSTP